MAGLASLLDPSGYPAGYAGYLDSRKRSSAEEQQGIQQAAGLMGLLQAAQQQQQRQQALQREQAFRGALGALPANATEDQVLAAVRPHASPDDLLKTITSSRDRQATMEATKQARKDALEARLYDIETRSQDRAATREQQAMLGKMADATRRELAAMNIEGRRELRALAGSLRQPPAPSLTEIVDPKDNTKMLRIDARSFDPARYMAGDNAGVIGVSGKEPTAQKKEEQVGAGRETVTTLLTNLKDAYQRLNTGGGIVNEDKGTLANVGARIGSTGIGQTAGQFAGTKNQMLRDSIEQQRPLLLNAIRQATGMSAKQMDSNVELKLYLAAATDPTKGYQANVKALEMLDKLYGTGFTAQPRQQGAPLPSPQAPKRLKFDAQGNLVP